MENLVLNQRKYNSYVRYAFCTKPIIVKEELYIMSSMAEGVHQFHDFMLS